MAQIAKDGTVSLSGPVPEPMHRISEFVAGEDVAAGDLVYVDATTFLVMRTAAVAVAGPTARAWGITGTDIHYNGQPCTFFTEARLHYGTALVPGTRLYTSATTPGGLADVAPFAGATPCAVVIDDTRIWFRSNVFGA